MANITIKPEQEVIQDLMKEVSAIAYSAKDYKDAVAFLKFINQNPPAKWIRERQGVKYMPIGIIETLMQRIFQRVRFEVKSYALVANSLTCSVRVHYWHPVYKDWEWQDGVGAVPIQIKNPNKDPSISAIDFAQMQGLAVQMGLPSAESYAYKDACEKIGKIFGRDISRKADIMEYGEVFVAPVDLEKEGFTSSKTGK